jgi:hypothetical protein
MDFTDINYLAVAVSAIASFVFGALWYSPLLFSKTWQKEVGLTEDDLKNANMIKIFGTSFVLTFIMATGMAFLMQGQTGTDFNWHSGLHIGALVGAFFVAASMGINYLYQRKSFKLWAIDAGYQFIFLCLMGIILGAWH